MKTASQKKYSVANIYHLSVSVHFFWDALHDSEPEHRGDGCYWQMTILLARHWCRQELSVDVARVLVSHTVTTLLCWGSYSIILLGSHLLLNLMHKSENRTEAERSRPYFSNILYWALIKTKILKRSHSDDVIRSIILCIQALTRTNAYQTWYHCYDRYVPFHIPYFFI